MSTMVIGNADLARIVHATFRVVARILWTRC